MPAQQARLVALAPSLASVSLSLNSSAIYLGSAMGAAVGALVIADGATGRLGWVATGFSVAALVPVLASGYSTLRPRLMPSAKTAVSRTARSGPAAHPKAR